MRDDFPAPEGPQNTTAVINNENNERLNNKTFFCPIKDSHFVFICTNDKSIKMNGAMNESFVGGFVS